jgi:hypothetical protein
MVIAKTFMDEEYWESFALTEEDIEFLYNHLLELETPLTSKEMVEALVAERIRNHKQALEKQRTSGGDIYQPKENFSLNQELIFPQLDWKHGKVVNIRPGLNPEIAAFKVIEVQFEEGAHKEFAAELEDHLLNQPIQITDDQSSIDAAIVIEDYYEDLVATLEDELETNPGFVRIAGRWFPRSLLVDINVGHLNLVEAVLDMAAGGPISTEELLKQIEFPTDVNTKLVEFSMDLALDEDQRFDEVGPAGDVLWFLKRLEPAEVLAPPVFLRYAGMETDRSVLTKEMLALESELDDELSPLSSKHLNLSDDIDIRLIFPHWRSGTLPLGRRVRHLFPTAYEAPRIRFMLVDGESGAKFPGWVVREKRYVYGLEDWYSQHGVMPGSVIRVQKGTQPGEVIVHTDSRRPSREWVRTVLIGSDGGVVFAMLKQVVSTPFDDRMTIAIPDKEAVDQLWNHHAREGAVFERLVTNTVRELAKLNPQSHVHASELYAAINILQRCPPGPILSLLASKSAFNHVGDLHFRLSSVDYD